VAKSIYSDNPLIKIILLLIGGNFANYLLMFFISLLVFRTVDRYEYGLFVTISSFLAIFLLLMSGYVQTVERYIKENINTSDKQKIIAFVFYYRLLLLVAMIGFVLLFRSYDFFNYFQSDKGYQLDIFDQFIFIAILNTIVSVFTQLNKSILKSMYQYRLVIKSEIVTNAIILACTIYLISFTQEYIYILFLFLVVRFFLALWISFNLNTMYREYSLLPICRQGFDLKIYKKYIISYATPLKASSVLTYIKNNIPILIIGKEFGMDNVAVYSVIKNFFKALHSFSGSFLSFLTSKFIDLKRNFDVFKMTQSFIYYATFFSRSAIYVSLVFLSDYFFEIYNIYVTDSLVLVFLILGLEYVVAGIMENYGVLLLLHNDTYKQLYVSLIRAISELLLIYLLLFDYGIVGAAIVMLLSRYIETLYAMILVIRDRIIRLIYSIHIVVFPAVVYFLIVTIR